MFLGLSSRWKERVRKRKPSVLEVSVDDAVVVEEVDGIEDGGEGIVLSRFALHADALNVRLEALVKLYRVR